MDSLKKQIEAGNFAVNNGAVIRTVNILNGGWIKYDVIKTVLDFVPLRNLIYLQRAGYIDVRYCKSKAQINVEDASCDDIEVTLTARGMKLTTCVITDEAVII